MDLHNELRSLIGVVRRRWTWLVGLRTMARASAGLAMLLVAGAIVESVFDCREFRFFFLLPRPACSHLPLRRWRPG